MTITDQQAIDIFTAMTDAVENNPALDDAPIERISGFALEFIVNEVAQLNNEGSIFDPNLFELATLILSDCGISENNQPLYDRVLGRLINARLPILAPTEQQILEATEKAGLWPNTVRTWLPAFHRYHAALASQAQQESRLTDEANLMRGTARKIFNCHPIYSDLPEDVKANINAIVFNGELPKAQQEPYGWNAVHPQRGGKKELAQFVRSKFLAEKLEKSGCVLVPVYLQSQVQQETNPTFLEEIDGLIANSTGVAGLHKNGEVATWDWLMANGWISLPQQEPESNSASNAAMEYALKNHDLEFLHAWFHGNFDAIRKEWSDAPEAVFIGADPLHPKTKGVKS